MHKVKELKIWKKSILLAKSIYILAEDLPSDEKYGLISQIKRSVISISSYITEGAGRNSNKEFKHFLGIANGSSFELQTQLILTVELKLLSKEKVQLAIDLLNEIQKMNYSLQKSIEDKFSILNTNI